MAALGYAAAYFGQLSQPQDTTVQTAMAEQAAAIDTVQRDIAGLKAAVAQVSPDVEAMIDEAAQSETAARAALATGIAADIAALETRIAGVERAPNADGTLAETALAAYTQQIEDLQAQIEALAASASTQIAAARDEAARIEAETADRARAGAVLASLSRVQAALDTGAPFADILPEMELALQAPVPEALSSIATEGAPTLKALQDRFSEAAGAALAAARREGVSGEDGGRLTEFLRSQFDVRSVEAREGNDADAILSRAEVALADARLTDALTEVAALPEVARAELTGWTADAERRAAALLAIETLTQTLTVTRP